MSIYVTMGGQYSEYLSENKINITPIKSAIINQTPIDTSSAITVTVTLEAYFNWSNNFVSQEDWVTAVDSDSEELAVTWSGNADYTLTIPQGFANNIEIRIWAEAGTTNKVTINDATIIDLTGDDVTAADVLSGVLFHLPSGEQGTGTLVPPSGGLEYESGTWSPTSNTTKGTINFTNTHTSPPTVVAVWDTASSLYSGGYTLTSWGGIDMTKLAGLTDTSRLVHAFTRHMYSTNSSSVSTGSFDITYGGWSSTSSSNNYWRYFADENAMYPYAATNVYMRTKRTYNWYAIWT